MKSDNYLSQLKTGAFILVDQPDRSNIMTIGWGGLIRMWNREIMLVPVRTSRYTHEFLQDLDQFIIAVPAAGEMTKELAVCGTKSGRDVDKLADMNRTASGGLVGCDNYRAKIVYRQLMEESALDQTINAKHYPNHDYHVIYYCEIEGLTD